MVFKYILKILGNLCIKTIILPLQSVNYRPPEITITESTNSINLSKQGLTPRWYLFEIKLDSFQTLTNACLVIHYENDKEVLQIPLKGGQTTRRTIWIKNMPTGIMLDLNENIIELDINYISFTRIYLWLAKFFLSRRLIVRHIAPDQDIARLWELYNETFTIGKFSAAYNSTYQSWIKKVEHKLPSPYLNKEYTPYISVIIFSRDNVMETIVKTVNDIMNMEYRSKEIIYPRFNEGENNPHPDTEHIRPVDVDPHGPLYKMLNNCKEHARGDLLIFLEAGNEMADSALSLIACCYHDNPDAKIYYSDDDSLNTENDRVFPRLKPDWNKLYFYSFDYISGFLIFNKDSIANMDFREGFEGVELFDFVLCCINELDVTQGDIIHIPRILFHSTGTTSGKDIDFEKMIHTNKIKSLREHLQNNYRVLDIALDEYDCTKIRFSTGKNPPKVSLIIPTRDNKRVLKNCIDSILAKTSYPDFEIIIVNNNSEKKETIEYLSCLSEHNKINVVDYPYPFNFSAINNYGVNQAAGTIIGLLNDDTEVINSDWLHEMVFYASQEDNGCIGAKLYYPNGNIQHGGVVLGLGHVAGHAHRYFPEDSPGYINRLNCVQYVSAVTAACMLVRKEIYRQVDGLDEENLTIAYNDVDFCLKVAAAGYHNIWTPHARLYHYESISRGSENTLGKKLRYRNEVRYMHEKWGDILKSDPFYHPYLTDNREDFSLKF